MGPIESSLALMASVQSERSLKDCARTEKSDALEEISEPLFDLLSNRFLYKGNQVIN